MVAISPFRCPTASLGRGKVNFTDNFGDCCEQTCQMYLALDDHQHDLVQAIYLDLQIAFKSLVSSDPASGS